MPPPNAMMHIPSFFNHYDLWIELIYSLVVVASCLLIYFKTRELYELTSHKGLKYFRNTFLFFGITYAVRFLLSLMIISRINPIIFQSMAIGIFEIAFFVMAYASSMALIYLIYSIFWKKIDKYSKNAYRLHIIALASAFIGLICGIPLFLGVQSILFLLLIVVSYSNYKKAKHKKSSQLYFLYLLIFLLWVISTILAFVVNFSPIIVLLIYTVSILSFLIILFRVLKKVKSK